MRLERRRRKGGKKRKEKKIWRTIAIPRVLRREQGVLLGFRLRRNFTSETGKNSGARLGNVSFPPTGWRIRRNIRVVYTIARISLQMSFPLFFLLAIVARTAPHVNARGKGLRFTATLKGLNWCAWMRLETEREKKQLNTGGVYT